MNVILYRPNKHKQINGTLFYSFEYFVYIKQFVSDVKFYIINASVNDLNYYKDIFVDKYDFNLSYLEDVLIVSSLDFVKLPIDNLLLLCTDSYKAIKDLSWNVKNIFTYSHNSHKFLNLKPNHTFYGWYEYQNYNKRTRLKFFKQIHKTFDTKGNKVFLSALNGNLTQIAYELKLDPAMLYTKSLNKHNVNLFANINKIVYYHTGCQDTNNRIVVESFIHGIPLELHLNGHTSDSIFERYTEITNNGLGQFEMTVDDIMIRDFLDGCSSLR